MPYPGQSRAPEGQAGGAEALPAWDLGDLYSGPESSGVTRDLARAETEAKDLAARYAGRLGALSGAELGEAIGEFERIEEILGRLVSYAQLLFSADSTNPAIGRFYQTMNERVTAIGSHMIFFALELNRLEEAALEPKLADPALPGTSARGCATCASSGPHQLGDALEKLLHEKEVTGHAAWSRLFDETIAAMRIAGRAARS